jgi:hypothetical protein
VYQQQVDDAAAADDDDKLYKHTFVFPLIIGYYDNSDGGGDSVF